jgi:hypothetical protein
VKTCSKCGEDKPLDGFYASKTTKDGLKADCKTCHAAAVRERRRATKAGTFVSSRVAFDPGSGKKYCPACGETKAVDQFSKNSHSSSGLGGVCRSCAYVTHKAWRAVKQAEARVVAAAAAAEKKAKLSTIPEKKCTCCSQVKPREQFPKKARATDGMSPWCRVCTSEASSRWYENNKDRRAETHKAWKEKVGAEAVSDYHRNWYLQNREKRITQCEAWRLANPGKHREKMANRRAKERNATPAWVDRAALQAIYDACPPGYEVDHIVPIRGKNVCGLHVPHNLQYLPMRENRSKGNRLIEENENGKAA